MPGTHTSKSTAPSGESPKKPIIIGYPVPSSELPSAERLGTSEEKARLELLSKVSVGLGRLAIGRRSDESGDSDRAIDRARIAFLRSRLYPDTPAYLLINTEDGSDDDNGDGSRRATWMRVDQGDFSTTINPDSEENHGLPPAEDALDAWEAQWRQAFRRAKSQPGRGASSPDWQHQSCRPGYLYQPQLHYPRSQERHRSFQTYQEAIVHRQYSPANPSLR